MKEFTAFLKATEQAAIESAKWIGRLDKHNADGAAVDAMRAVLNSMDIDATVVIGEGEIDEAPMLFIGEKVGTGNGPKYDIAVDPLEGTEITSKGKHNALSVLAVALNGKFLHAPDCYMKKIAVGPKAAGVISLYDSTVENLQRIAQAKQKRVKDLTVAILDRPRNYLIIKDVKDAGAKLSLISDGDILAALATCIDETGVDVLLGIGGAPEGVVAAAAIKCFGGDFQASLELDTDSLKERAKSMGIEDFDKHYTLGELASGDLAFFATGVTDGYLLDGVKTKESVIETSSMVVSSFDNSVMYIKKQHLKT